MLDPSYMEEAYQTYMSNLKRWVDCIQCVDLAFLDSIDLLRYWESETSPAHLNFNVIESLDKVSLFNDNFVVWLVPDLSHAEAMTYILIASVHQESLHMELVLSASGVYNSSYLLMRVVDALIADIQENDAILANLGS